MRLDAIDMATQTIIPVLETSQIGEARRQAIRLAELAGFDEPNRGKAAIIATELATNLVRHARGGEIHLQTVNGSSPLSMDITAVDRGPGMRDLAKCLADGYSTGGTAGNGLGAVRRMATEFDIHTAESGTIVFTRLNQQAAVVVDKALFQWSVISRPAPHEVVCGDSWRIAAQADELAILIADGLGHGPQAAEAALGAALAFDADPFAPPSEIVRSADARMRGSRGGAVASALINGRSRKLRYCGVGNIAGSIRSCNERNHRGLVSHNGIVGAQIHKIQEFEYDCPTNGLLIVYSDGLQSRWSLDAYPGLELRHPALIASVLFRDFTRGRDDVTVCVVRFTLN